ncbi:MAG: prepilin-type N-terminal cleavage/methylation domain-containing protein [Granulosicoccus sp.]
MHRSISLKEDKESGFTLIELMIVIAIIGILASIAVPRYSQYTKRATFSEVKVAMSPIKNAIIDCYQRNAGDAGCNESNSSVSALLPGQVTDAMLVRAEASNLISDVNLTAGAIPLIQATAVTGHGFTGETYTLTGVVAGTPGTDARINDWIEGGSACTTGWC